MRRTYQTATKSEIMSWEVAAKNAKWREVSPFTATDRKGREPVNANEMKHAASLEEWKQRIMECRASGLPVRTWCEQHAYNTSTYYCWERELFGRIKKPPGETDLAVRSELLPAAKKQELVEIPVVEETAPAISESGFCPVAVVRVGGIELSLSNGVSSKLMKHLKELLRYAE